MNSIKTNNDTEVYKDIMHILAEEYEEESLHPEYLYKYSSQQFTGMIKHIHKYCGYDRDILADIDKLNNIWDSYTDIAYSHNQKPTIEEFAILLGISRDTIYAWANGEYRRTDICKKLSLTRPDTVKKWIEECKAARIKGASAGNFGDIFLCKAVDGMREDGRSDSASLDVKKSLSDAQLPDLSCKMAEIEDKTPDIVVSEQ